MARNPIPGRLNRESNPVPGTLAGFNPQFYDADGHAVDVDVNNPYPVGNYIKQGSLWIPVSSDNPMPTKDDEIKQKIEELNQKVDEIVNGNAPANVRLTGSYVEYNAAQRNFSITAGASKTIEFIFDRNVEAFVITLYKPQAHTTSKPTYMFRLGTYGAPAFSVELPLLNENTSRGFTSKKIDVLHNRAIMILSNNDTSDQNYSVFVTLFKKSLDGSVTISEI